MTCLLLFYEFFKTGLFAVGGGLATLPFLYDPEWFTMSQLADMLAVSESTPGPLGVNMATYVGYLTAGIPGAVAATMGLVAPSVIVILIVAAFLKRFRESRLVNNVFYGLRRYGGGGGPVRGGTGPALQRPDGSYGGELEGCGAGGGAVGADPLVQTHQGPASHRVHSGLRHHRRGVLLLKNEYKSQYSHRRLRYVVTFCVKIAPPAKRTGETMKKRVSRRLLPSGYPESAPQSESLSPTGRKGVCGKPGRVSCTRMIPIFQSFLNL